ncbi:MAG: hypothetical protein ACRD1L_08250 [Terriglobales bacterium]
MIKLLVLAVAFAALALQGFALGVDVGVGQLPGIWRKPGLYARFFLATFVIMPLVAVAMHKISAAPHIVWGGLVLLSVCPPSAGLGSRIKKLGGSLSIGEAWQAQSLLWSLLTVPVTLWLLQRGLQLHLELPLRLVIQRVLAWYLIPELIGFGCARWLAPSSAIRWASRANRISLILLGILAALMLLVTATRITTLSLGSWAFILVFSILSVVVGLLLGGPPATLRPTLATALATRWPMPVLVLAQVNRIVLPVLPVLVGYLVFGMLTLLAYGRIAAPRQPAVVLPKAA